MNKLLFLVITCFINCRQLTCFTSNYIELTRNQIHKCSEVMFSPSRIQIEENCIEN